MEQDFVVNDVRLGEPGTEQFTVETRHDEKLIGSQAVHDPLIHTTVIIRLSRWSLFKAMFRMQFETRVRVDVHGTPGAVRAIMALNPARIHQETLEILEQNRISRETSPVMGYTKE